MNQDILWPVIACLLISALFTALLWTALENQKLRERLLYSGHERAESMGDEDEAWIRLEAKERENENLREENLDLSAENLELRDVTRKQAMMLTPLMYDRMLPEIQAASN